jgi:hypothetical protein
MARKLASRRRRTMRKTGGTPSRKSAFAKKLKDSRKKLDTDSKHITESKFVTPGELSGSMPAAINAAKKAIDEYLRDKSADAWENAKLRSDIADLWTEHTGNRRNWRKESRDQSGKEERQAKGQSWYLVEKEDQYVLGPKP